jgi:hypothetical protein
MNRIRITLGLIHLSLLCGASLPMGLPDQNAQFIGPYILLGESGKSVEVTTKKIIGQFFMQNIEVLGKYSPANDPDRFVLVVTHPGMQKGVWSDHPTSALATVIRIGITAEGQMTYVSCQNPEYWGNAYLQERYAGYAGEFDRFLGHLRKTMPRMRGRFSRTFGGDQVQGLTSEDIQHFQYNRRSERLEDTITLAQFDTYELAVKRIHEKMGTSATVEKVFELEFPEQKLMLLGIAYRDPPLEERILELLDSDRLKRTACLPLEILVSGNQVLMLSPRYRLSLSFPDLDRKAFRQLNKLQQELIQVISSIVQ